MRKSSAELLAHLLLPLRLQRGWADDQDASGALPGEQFLYNEPGLDGLAETDVIGDQEVDARHLQRPHNGVELVVLDLDGAAEGRLKREAAQDTAGRPTDSIREGPDAVWRVPRGRFRPAQRVNDHRVYLVLPQDREPLSERVVLEALELNLVVLEAFAATDDVLCDE